MGIPDRAGRSAPIGLRRATGRVLVLAAAVPIALQAVVTALATIAGAAEARLVDAAFADLRPSTLRAVPVGLDELAARVQLSGYAAVTGAFDRHAHVLTGARELALVASAVLLLAVVALARSLGVRPAAAAVVLLGLAVFPPAVAVLATFGPGLLGAAWLTAGAALLARTARWQHALAVPAVVAGVVSAPVLAVPLLVVAAAYLVAVRVRRRGPLLLGVAVVGTALPLALLPAPGGAAAVPALLVVAVLVGFVLVDEAGSALARRSRPVAVATGAVLGAAALAVVLVPVPAALSRVTATVDGAPGLAAWLAAATDPATGAAVPAGVWSDLVRAGVPAGRLGGGPLAVTAGGEGAVLARFGQGRGALAVSGPVPGPAGAAAGAALAGDPDLDAPEEVRAVLRGGAVDPRAAAVLAALAARGPVAVVDLPAVPGEDPAVPRHRVVLADAGAEVRAVLATQQPPYVPMVVEGTRDDSVRDSVPMTLTWPLPAPAL